MATFRKEVPIFKVSKLKSNRQNQWDPYSWKHELNPRHLWEMKDKANGNQENLYCAIRLKETNDGRT